MVKFQKGKSSKSIGPQVTEDLFFIPGSRPKDNQLENPGRRRPSRAELFST
jgi:hypothetical protein